MMRFVIYFFLFVTMLVAEQVSAEGGSSYSFFGVGDIVDARDARSFALGGVSFGLWNRTGVNAGNPATWSNLSQTTLDVGYAFQYLQESDQGVKGAYNTSRVRSVFAVAPAWKEQGLSIGLGLQPLSEVNYSVRKTETVDSNVTATTNYVGGGGLSIATIGASIKVIDEIAVAATLNYIYGSVRNSIATSYSDPNFVSTIIDHSKSYAAFQPSFSFVARPVGGLTLGGMYTLGVNGEVTKNETHYAVDPSLDTTAIADSTVFLPASFGAGVAYTFVRMTIAADYWSEAWSTFKTFGVHPANLQDASRISFGIERSLNADPKINFFDRIALRAGARMATSYITVGGDGIKELFGSVGVGLPVTSTSTIDIGFEYGTRERASGMGIKENIFRMAVSLSASELWFAPSPDDE